MANAQHVTKLAEGFISWNQWRQENPRIRPDLSGTVLSDPLPEWAFWKPVVMNLDGINFSRVNLRRCVLRGASLVGADLRRADLKGADLRKANLTNADLTNASVNHANLTLATLHDTVLTNVLFWETVLARVSLNGAKGLESCRHGGPSIVDHRTLRRSPDVPDSFWRGCGLPDELIDSFRAMAARDSTLPSFFISYSTADSNFASKLYKDLQARGIDCWMAEHNLKGGVGLEEQIESAIGECDRTIIILSESSIESRWVLTEVQRARKREIDEQSNILFPIRTVPYAKLQSWKCFDTDMGEDIAKAVRRYFIPDFSEWRDDSKYAATLEEFVGGLVDVRTDDKRRRNKPLHRTPRSAGRR